MTETVEPVRWDRTGSEAAAAANRETARRLERHVRARERDAALAMIEGWRPADIVASMVMMRSKHARRLLEWMPDEPGLGVLAQVDPRFSAVLAEAETVAKFRKVLARLDPDRAFDLLEGLPDEMVETLLAGHPEADVLRAALAMEEDTAGHAMRYGLLSVPETATVADVVEAVRARQDALGRLERIFVVDGGRRLKGYLRLRDLLTAAPDTAVTAILQPDALAVTAETDRADVLALAEARGRTDLAVVDGQGRLIGSITARELAEIAQEEADEDMLLMAGVSPESTSYDSPLQIVRRRLPWIVVGLGGSLFSATVVGAFDETLQEAAILASFIPVVMATVGNAGIQASTVSIQAITRGARWGGDFGLRLGREMLGAAGNGLVVGLIVAAAVFAIAAVVTIANPGLLALACFLSLFVVTLVAGTVGALIPFVLDALRIDPAVATGIFMTMINDSMSVLVFFLFASSLYL